MFRVKDSTGTVIVNKQVAFLPPASAEMIAVPASEAETTPSSTLATESSDEDQIIDLFVASSGLTVASKVKVSPLLSSTERAFSSMEYTATMPLETVTRQDPDFPPADATIVAVPSPTAVTKPFSETVATVDFVVAHVISDNVAFDGTIVALSSTVSPTQISAVLWLSETERTWISCSFVLSQLQRQKTANAIDSNHLIRYVMENSLLSSISQKRSHKNKGEETSVALWSLNPRAPAKRPNQENPGRNIISSPDRYGIRQELP